MNPAVTRRRRRMSVSGDRAEMGLTKLSSNLNVFLTNFRVMRVWV